MLFVKKSNIRELLFIITLSLHSLYARACGIDWNPPKNQIENYTYWREIFNVNIGKGLQLPVYAKIYSEYKFIYMALGESLSIPIIESKITEINEREFIVLEPSGHMRLFWRDANNKNILYGKDNWKALINNKITIVWSACGDKLTFINGSLYSMNIKGKVLNIKHIGSSLFELQKENGQAVLLIHQIVILGKVLNINIHYPQFILLEKNNHNNTMLVVNKKPI